MNKKTFTLIGLIAGILAVVLGILILAGVFGGDTRTGGSAYSPYDSGYTRFGADFYTYVSNNAQEAASASRTAATNLDEIARLLKFALGGLCIVFGLFSTALFGCKFVDLKEQGKPAPTEAPAAETAAPEAAPAPAASEIRPEQQPSGESGTETA